MKMRRSLASLAFMSLMLVACGSPEDAATTTAPSVTLPTTTDATEPTTTAIPTTTVPATTTTLASSTTTVAESATTSGGLPGEVIDFGPAAGDTLAVMGVAHDDVLNLRAAPGASQAILAGIPPLYSDLTALGETRQLTGSMWIQVEYEDQRGWVNLRFIAYLGDTTDVTADVISNLGERPVAETMLGLGLIVAETFVSEEPRSDLVVSVAPTVGDLGEVTYDVVGLGDDAVRGVRLHVFGQPVDGGFSLDAVEMTTLCGRGADSDGFCL